MATSQLVCSRFWRFFSSVYVRFFWLFVVAFNVAGVTDLIVDYYHATLLGLPAIAGHLGATYAIPIIFVPLLMITHVVAFCLLLRPLGASAAQRHAG